MAKINLRDLMRAKLTDSVSGPGKNSLGPGGPSNAARDRHWQQFLNSAEGRYLNSIGQPLEPYFEQKYYGGAMPMQFGATQDPADMERWLDKVTGVGLNNQSAATMDPRTQRTSVPMGANGTGVSGVTGSQQGGVGADGIGLPGAFQPTLLNAYLASAGNSFNERNAAVKARENEIRASQDALYGRVMGEVDNWGGTEERKIKDTYQTNLDNQLAYLAERGLGGSTVGAAFTGDKDRDQQDALLDLSERKSDRKLGYDIPLTQRKEDFVERITDRGPSMQEIMQVAQMLGSSGAGATPLSAMFGGQFGQPVARSNKAGLTGTPQMPAMQQGGSLGNLGNILAQQPLMTPWGPVQRASYNPEGRQPIRYGLTPADIMPTFQSQQGIVSNAYPTVRKKEVQPNPVNGPKQMVPRPNASGYPLDLASILAGAGAMPVSGQMPMQIPYRPAPPTASSGVKPVSNWDPSDKVYDVGPFFWNIGNYRNRTGLLKQMPEARGFSPSWMRMIDSRFDK
jgi:hypothetical protein